MILFVHINLLDFYQPIMPQKKGTHAVISSAYYLLLKKFFIIRGKNLIYSQNQFLQNIYNYKIRILENLTQKWFYFIL